MREVLAEIATAAWAFYNDAIPMGASIFADPELLARQRALLANLGAGPHRANEAVAAYLRAEQELGRVRADADPDAAAYLLLGPSSNAPTGGNSLVRATRTPGSSSRGFSRVWTGCCCPVTSDGLRRIGNELAGRDVCARLAGG